MDKYPAIMNLINEKLESNANMLTFYRDKVAELEKENAELKEANSIKVLLEERIEELEKENNQLKEKIENLTF